MKRLHALTGLFLAFTLAACADDTGSTQMGSGGSGGMSTSAGPTSGSTTSGSTTASSSQSSSSGTTSTSTGAGGGSQCPPILFESGSQAACDNPGPLALANANTAECAEDIGVYWPAKIYRVPVTAGDCLHMRADNVGSPAGADLFGAIVDPNGKSVLFDEEFACSVPNPDSFACPEGGVTVEMTGDAHIVVGAFGGNGCPAQQTTPFQLTVSINAVDVDLSAGELCAGDLLQIIP